MEKVLELRDSTGALRNTSAAFRQKEGEGALQMVGRRPERPGTWGSVVWWKQSIHGGLRPQRESPERSCSNKKADKSGLLEGVSQT